MPFFQLRIMTFARLRPGSVLQDDVKNILMGLRAGVGLCDEADTIGVNSQAELSC